MRSLTTKTRIPSARRALVERPRLHALLDRGIHASLTLVSAPAGFGKTTAVADWLGRQTVGGSRLAWLSLDERDNEPAAFWTGVLAAARSGEEQAGAALASALEAGRTDPGVLADAFLADVAARDTDAVWDWILVLDDYHLIDSAAVQDDVAHLLENLPPHVRIIITTRADPRLPLAQLRARGELVEVRATDLRFTDDEALTYLSESMALPITPVDATALAERTEGWIAALQLAALSLCGRERPEEFISRFAGDDRFVVDYLAQEVLDVQPPEVREFLLATSVLSRFTGALCDAVTGTRGGAAMIERLEGSNLFVLALDDQREWYRYHQLFADVLASHLRRERADDVPGLHERAARWLADNEDWADAMHHAFAAGNDALAAEVVERAVPHLRRSRSEHMLLAWMRALPVEVTRARPSLALAYAGALMATGEVADVEGLLDLAEQGVADAGVTNKGVTNAGVADTATRQRVAAEITAYRAALARALGDQAAAASHARRALELVEPGDHLGRGAAAGLVALTEWSDGRLDEAFASWEEASASLTRAGHVADSLGCAIGLADIRIAQGRLRDAQRIYERHLELATAGTGDVLRGAADMHVGLATLAVERESLDTAREHLEAAAALGAEAGLPQFPHRLRLAQSSLARAEADLDRASALLDEAETLYAGDFFPDAQPVAAIRARLRVSQGRADEALEWARASGLRIDDAGGYLTEYARVTLALALVVTAAQAHDSEGLATASALLGRFRDEAESTGRRGTLVEVLAIESLATEALPGEARATEALRRALSIAEPEGYVRTFANIPGLAPVLARLAQGAGGGYTRRVLAAVRGAQEAPPASAIAPLVEPLSGREFEVLRLLAGELDGPGMARELFISLNTLRTHTKSIYAKLGVTNRRAAVRSASERGLLTPSPDA